MVEQALVVVQAEQQRADVRRPLVRVAEAADDAVGRAELLDLQHAGPFAGSVRQVRDAWR